MEAEEEAGVDGENPVTPQNPPAKAVGYMSEDAYGGTPAESDEDEAEEEAEEEDKAPAKSALKEEWVDYAVSKGADRDEAEDQTKEDLIAAYGD